MLKDFLRQHNIYTLQEAAIVLEMNYETLKKQCQAGKRDAVNLGVVWLVKLDTKNVKSK